MKKYISFIVLASFVFSFSFATLATAKEGSDDGIMTTTATTVDDSDASESSSNKIKPTYDVKTIKGARTGTPPDGLGIKKELQDIREVRQEDRTLRQEDRQAFRLEIQTERKAFINDLKTKRDAFLADVKVKKEEWKTVKADRKAQFCEAARNMMTVRFETVVTQLEKYQGKVGDIITQLKADGKDTTDAQAALDLSKSKLADAKAKLASLKGTIPADCKDVTAEQFEKVKVGARETKDLLKESREALHEAVKDIRNLKGEDTSDDGPAHDANDDSKSTQ